MLRKAWNKLEGTNGLVLAAYVFVVLILQAFITKGSVPLYLKRSFFSIAAFSLLVCPIVLRQVRKLSIRRADNHLTQSGIRRWFICIFAITFACLFLVYLMYYPGGSSPDTVDQLEQARTNQYNDWHPVMHTLFAYKLPLAVSGGWIGSIVLFQILLFSAVIAYSVITILMYTNRGFAIASFVFYLMNPSTVIMAVIPWKDVSFAIGALLLLTYTIKIYFTKGLWFKKYLNIVLYLMVFAMTTLFRHNALLFTVPMGITAMFYIPNKRRIVLLIGAVVLIFGMKGPLYSILQVESPDSRQIETLGLPMNIIGSVVTYNPDSMDDETREFAYRIATQEKWQEKYRYGNYNSLKWDEQTNNDVIEEYGAPRVLKIALSCMMRSPREAITGLIRLTDPVYTLTDDFTGYNGSKLDSRGNGFLSKSYIALTGLIDVVFPHLFHYIGTMMIVLLVAALSKCRILNWNDFKRIMLVVPVFAYNFGTMLLLTGRDDAYRFFHYTFLLVPLYLIFFFGNNQNGKDLEAHLDEP